MQILVWKHEEVFGLLIEDKLLTMWYHVIVCDIMKVGIEQ